MICAKCKKRQADCYKIDGNILVMICRWCDLQEAVREEESTVDIIR